jgi:hypothetical protein
MVVPKPRQFGHGRIVRTSPRNERCVCVTSPRPWQISQVTGSDPAAAPDPEQVGQTTAVSTFSSRVVPNAASLRSIRSGISAS